MTAGLDIATAALRRAKAMKDDIVRRDGIGEDLVPHLDLWNDGEPWMTAFLSGGGVDHAKVIAGALGCSRCDLAVFITEGYTVTQAIVGPDPEHLRRGELAERFAAGDPGVQEGLLVALFPRGEPSTIWMVPYRYDGRTVIWGEEQRSDDNLGLLSDAAAYAYANRLPDDQLLDHATLATELMGLGCVECVGLFMEAPPARNQPCPCGSGVKAKRCDHGRN